ncbi:MAG: hypothetical protein IPP83_00725 [Flavobacteriales bacterium]|nr:hypothetical protein [Flavobacteriales bacterium]
MNRQVFSGSVTPGLHLSSTVLACSCQMNADHLPNLSGLLTRMCVLLMCCTGSFVGVAQRPTVRHFIADAPLGSLQVKEATRVLKGLDQAAVVSFQAEQLKVRLSSEVSDTEALAALNSGGHHYMLPDPIRSQGQVPDAGPVFVDTGDPAGDVARYKADKQTWIEAHPDAAPPASPLPSGPLLKVP